MRRLWGSVDKAGLAGRSARFMPAALESVNIADAAWNATIGL